MKFTQTISLDEYREANRVATRKSSFLLHLLLFRSWIIGLLILVVIFVFQFANDGPMKQWSWFTSVIVLTSLLTFFVILPAHNRTFTRNRFMKFVESPQGSQMELTEVGFSTSAPDGSSSFLPWSRFRTYLDCQRVILLGFDTGGFITIPKRALTPDQQAELRTLLAAHIP